MITGNVVLSFAACVTLGILLFDLYLLLFAKGQTISRSVIRAPAWVQIGICAAISFLIWHFWGE
jgi:hypothetical protein